MTRCLLRCLDGRHAAIELPHKVPTLIGRGPLTKITEKRCSRKQVEVLADHTKLVVEAKLAGQNPSCVNGQRIQGPVKCYHNDQLEVLEGEYFYIFEFDPPPEKTHMGRKETSAKRKTTEDNGKEEPDKKPESKRLKTDEVSKNGANVTNVLMGSKCAGSNSNRWEDVGGGDVMVYTPENCKPSEKIAAYDIDWTIIKTKSGKVFPSNIDDWQLFCAEVPGKLKQLHKDGYKIVFVTNQSGIASGKLTRKDFKKKAESIIHKIGVPAQTFVSIGKGIYRKPALGIWDSLQNQYNGGVDIEKAESFYIGDAAGRPANPPRRKKKDFSSSDRLFALNIGILFKTPEEHFLHQKPEPYDMPSFNPRTVDANQSLTDPPDAKLIADNKEVLLCVGAPGSGKSFVVSEYLVPAGYTHINRDTLGTWQKCLQELQCSLAAGRRAVVDNTNPDVESRKKFIDAAKSKGISVRCLLFTEDLQHAKHNNKFREFTDSSHEHVGDMIFNMYKSKYVPPTLSEGFTEIIKINFIPKFRSKQDEELYRLYLLEK